MERKYATVDHYEYWNDHIANSKNYKKVLKAGNPDEIKRIKEWKAEDKAQAKAFKKKYGMFRYPLMADIFDIAEEDRSLANSKTAFNKEIKIVKDVVYKEIDGQKLVMDIYLPSNPVGEKNPVVVDVPGGGWVIHNRPRRDGYARLFAAMGAVVCVIDHRLSPEVFFPENLKDVIDAINFLDEIKDEFNLDVNDVTITGDSSGGHLSACAGCASSVPEYGKKLGLAELKVKIKRCIFISGAFSFETMYRISFTHTLMVRYFSGRKSRSEFRSWEFYKESIPYNYLTKDFPESYNNGGGLDLLCLGEAKRMAKKLTAAGVKNEYKVGKNILNNMHCYVLRTPFAPARHDMTLIMDWYRRSEKEAGVDMSANFERVKKSLEHKSK